MKYYEALGLEPKLALDSEDLKKRFYAQSRLWHPDRFGRASASERQESLDMTALLNDGFRTLKEPVARAEYFLESNGIPPSKNPPPELLEEVFELNMALEELREGDSSARPQLESARERFTGCSPRAARNWRPCSTSSTKARPARRCRRSGRYSIGAAMFPTLCGMWKRN